MKTILILLALAGAAFAEPLIKPPPGWSADVPQADKLRAKANDMPHFGGAKSFATAEVYLAPKPGVALFVTAVAAKVSAERDVAARVAVDELHATSQRAALAGSGILEDAWQERVDPKNKHVEATLTWRDTGAATVTHARMLVVADPENIATITGECVAASGADPKVIDACKAALATLYPGLAADKRVPIALAPPGSQLTPVGGGPPATMSDGSRAPLPPITVRQEDRSTDRRPVYVGAGIVLLTALFWWNRRRRARFEKEPP